MPLLWAEAERVNIYMVALLNENSMREEYLGRIQQTLQRLRSFASRGEYARYLISAFLYVSLKANGAVGKEYAHQLHSVIRADIGYMPEFVNVLFGSKQDFHTKLLRKAFAGGVSSLEFLDYALYVGLLKVSGKRLPSKWLAYELFDRLTDTDISNISQAVLWLNELYGLEFAKVIPSRSLEQYLGLETAVVA